MAFDIIEEMFREMQRHEENRKWENLKESPDSTIRVVQSTVSCSNGHKDRVAVHSGTPKLFEEAAKHLEEPVANLVSIGITTYDDCSVSGATAILDLDAARQLVNHLITAIDESDQLKQKMQAGVG